MNGTHFTRRDRNTLSPLIEFTALPDWLTGCDSATWTVNQDALAATDEDPALVLLGGDGVAAPNDDLIRVQLALDTSAEQLRLTMERSRNGAAYARITPTLHIGQPGDTTAGLDAGLQFNSVTDAGAASVGTITYLGQEADLQLSAPLGARVSAQRPLEPARGLDRRRYWELTEDFLQGSGNLPGWLSQDLHNASTIAFETSLTGGVIKLGHTGGAGAESSQILGNARTINLGGGGGIFRARLKIDFAGATFSADQRFVVGLADVHANAEDSLDAVPLNCWFRIEGADLSIFTETDDGSTDTDDNDTGVDIVDDTYTLFEIDFTTLSAVLFYVNGVQVASHNLSAASSGRVAPIVCLQRDAGSEAEAVYLDFIQVVARR